MTGWTRWTAVAGTLALGAGCAAPRAHAFRAAEKPPFTFTVAFAKTAQGLCPVDVTMAEADQNCETTFTKEKDCVKVVAGKPHRFRFQASMPDAPPFEIRFHPFRAEDNAQKGPIDFTIDDRAPPKVYSFNVLAKDCPPRDPRIIIEW